METFSRLFTVEFWLVAAAIYVFITFVRKTYPVFFDKPFVKRVLPFFPIVSGVLCMALIPGLSAWTAFGAKILHGLVAGFVASHMHQISKNTFLGKAKLGDQDDVAQP